MQPNQITLAVDEENDGVGLANHVYTRFEDFQNRATYISADHALDARDTLSLYRTLPKPNGNFRGTAKTAVKFSKDFTVNGVTDTVSAPLIIEVSISLPVGVSAANALIARQRVIALLDRDDVMVPLMEQQMI